MNILTDVHTHTTFSPDGIDDIHTMLDKAKLLRLAFWGISEHFDYDYYVDGISFIDEPTRFTDAEKYFTTARKLQAENTDVRILVGAELGFTRNNAVNKYYHALLQRYKPDFIVNSVHTQGRYDYYQKEAFVNTNKQSLYQEYLTLVRESLDVDYPYDIVGHIGYPARFAPFPDKYVYYNEFSKQLDDILNVVIEKDKILELNSSTKGLQTSCLPFPEIVKRYFELGGRNVSFASDAHDANRLTDGRTEIISLLKKIGFTHLTVPCQGEKIKIKI